MMQGFVARTMLAGVAAIVLVLPSAAQKKGRDALSGYDRSARATVLHEAVVYVAPDDTSQKVAVVTPGHEMVIVERNGPWVKVFANTDTPDQGDPSREPEFESDEAANPSSGWVKDKGIVSPQTGEGDAILFGAAANMEELASQPHAPKGAAQAAHMLYQRVYEYFPESPLDGESSWRAADIRWQLEKLDNSTLPSAKEQEAYLRPQLYDGDLKRVIKSFPGSKYAFLAAYDMLDNKLCGDWQGLPRCPEMEAGLYLKYAEQYPESPRAAEAMYNAVYREGVLVTMYTVEENRKRADAAAARVAAMAAEMRTRFGSSDFTRRAQSIAFKVKQGIPIFGSDRD